MYTHIFGTFIQAFLVFLRFADTLSMTLVFRWSIECGMTIYAIETRITSTSVLVQFRLFHNITTSYEA